MSEDKLNKEAKESWQNDGTVSGASMPGEIYVAGYLASAESREKRIEELEQENERLKGDLELWESGDCRATNLFECGVVKELKEQLTKAKEIIKDLMSFSVQLCDCRHTIDFEKQGNKQSNS